MKLYLLLLAALGLIIGGIFAVGFLDCCRRPRKSVDSRATLSAVQRTFVAPCNRPRPESPVLRRPRG